MDIRCERCGAEYELDPAQLKPGGVTVRCTECQNLFRVAVGGGASPEWLVRLENGEIHTCKDWGTLLSQIANGIISPAAEISRDGTGWKRLGDLPELAPAFAASGVVTKTTQFEAQDTVPASSMQRSPFSTTQPMGGKVHNPAAIAEAGLAHAVTQSPFDSTLPHMSNSSPGSRPTASITTSPPSSPPPVDEAELGLKEEDTRSISASWRIAPTPRAGSEPAFAKNGPRTPASSAPPPAAQGPVGGLSKAIPVHDAAFTVAQKTASRSGVSPLAERYDPEPEFGAKGSVAKWLVVGALAVIVVAAGVVFWVLGRDTKNPGLAAVVPDAAVAAQIEAPPATPDAAVVDPRDASAAIALAKAALAADVGQSLNGADAELQKLIVDPNAPDVRILVAQTNVAMALAQRESDRQVWLADKARKNAQDAMQKFVKRARRSLGELEKIGAVPSQEGFLPIALLQANIRRLNGEAAAEVERWLRQAKQSGSSPEQTGLAAGLLYQRDGRLRDAEREFAKLPEPAARFRIALIRVLEKNQPAALAALETFLAADPEHELGVECKTALTTQAAAPIPPPPSDVAVPDNNGGEPAPVKPAQGFAALLSEAKKQAKSGNCEAAIVTFKRALDEEPANVEGLTGLGLCHLERKDFASAHAKFRAALGISPNYADAMWAMAQTYEIQGNSAQAVTHYRKFMDAHAGTARAKQAEAKVKELGGTQTPAGAGDEPAPPPAPTPEPTQPTQPPENNANPPSGTDSPETPDPSAAPI